MKRDGDEEQRVRRGEDAHRVGELLERVLPDREPEDHHRAEQPQQRVALHQPPAAHQLEHDDQQGHRAGDGDDLDPALHQIPCSAATGAASPGSGTGRTRASPTNRASSTLIM